MIPQRAGINQVLETSLCGPNAHQGGEGLPAKVAAHPGAGTGLGLNPHPDTTHQLLAHSQFLPVLTSPESQNLRLNSLLLFTSVK